MDLAPLKSYGLLVVCGILACLSIVVTICFSCARHGRDKPGSPHKNRPTGGATGSRGGNGLSDGLAFANTLLYSSAYGVVVDGGDGGGGGGDNHHQGHDGGGGGLLPHHHHHRHDGGGGGLLPHHHHHHHDGGQNGGGYSGDGGQYDIGGDGGHDGGGDDFSAGGGFDGGGF